jgi:hypothetical protein
VAAHHTVTPPLMCHEDQKLVVGQKHGVEVLISLDISLDDVGDMWSSRKIELRYLSGMK